MHTEVTKSLSAPAPFSKGVTRFQTSMMLLVQMKVNHNRVPEETVQAMPGYIPVTLGGILVKWAISW